MALGHDDIGGRDAPPVILVHSLGCDRRMWRAQVDALSSSFRVIAVDIRGHGRSAVPDGDYRLEQLGRDVIEVADLLTLDTFHYCGLSIGGLIGQWLGLNAAARLRSLTLCNTGAKISELERWNERIEVARTQGMAALVDAVIERWFTPAFIASHPDDIARARTWLLETDAEGYAGCCAAIRGADLRDEVRAITARTLVVGGTGDVATPPEQSEYLHEQIAGSELRLLAAGHLSNIEQEAEFTEALLGFLG
jgi:3-oxoadipate enol-lactonase